MSEKKTRPLFPKRAVVTAGMPYGNKQLHFGHIGGVFVHADTFARFLRDRLGAENVLFVSGTDCYGSPIVESFRRSQTEDGFGGSIEDFVMEHHEKQRDVLERYQISLDLFGTSAFGDTGRCHEAVSREIFEALRKNGYLSVRDTPQFYDRTAGVYLNGRQVTGRCPIQGCKSEVAYADECALGHQYSSNELIAPKSVLSGETPEIKTVKNWYFDLPRFEGLLRAWAGYLAEDTNTRKSVLKIIEEFLKPPMLYVKREQFPEMEEMKQSLPAYVVEDEAGKASVTVVFQNLEDREAACQALRERGIRFRTGKTLVPFRLTGNVAWGVPVPQDEVADKLTFWVWPESLWAPISFTKALLARRGEEESAWKRFWKSQDAAVYQFIGEDNIYFYAIAEIAMFMALQGKEPGAFPKEGQLRLPQVMANKHILFQDKKASSSGKVKPPTAGELLGYYTPEQLRMHFLGLGLATKSVNFQPKAFSDQKDSKEFDKVLKEGNLLTNVYNRLIRSCFYTLQKYGYDHLPALEVSAQVKEEADAAILQFEESMARYEFHTVINDLDVYLRNANKRWSAVMKTAQEDPSALAQLLVDSFHVVRVAATLLHPIAPEGCEKVRSYLGFGEEMWNWRHVFEPVTAFIDRAAPHAFRFLEPRVDFFEKHESQMEQ